MMSISTIAMSECTCWRCGVLFAVPHSWLKAKMDSGKSIVCPNGHTYTCVWKDETDAKALKEENERLRREIMQVRHDADQAEARLRDERPAHDRAEVVVADVVDDSPGGVTALKPAPGKGRVFCPHCDATYKSAGALRRHLIDVHHDDATAKNLTRLLAAIEG